MAKVLERRCLVTPGEAKRRMLAADAAGPRQTPTGLPLPRLRGHVSTALEAGTITPHQVEVVDETLDKLDRADVHTDQVEEVEAELVAHCRQFAPKALRTLCQRYLDALDPDGPEPNEQRNQERRSWRMHTTPSGAVVGEFRLTPETGAKAKAIFSSLGNPRVDTTGGMATTDLRSHEQRLHDAFDDMLSRLLRSGGLPDSGGTPATVIVTIDQADLLNDLAQAGLFKPPARPDDATVPSGTCPTCGQDTMSTPPTVPAEQPEAGDDAAGDGEGGNEPPHPGCSSTAPPNKTSRAPDHDPLHEHDRGRAGRVRRARPRHGTTSDGTPLTVRELLQLAGEAEIYPVVLTQHGVLLEMGRNRRIANKHQTLALIARDGGCSFPGCDRPPEWCQRHHIVPWHDNGPTDFRNMTLLCSYHHRHFLNRGWQVQINPDGLPEWIPPRYLDPEQKPLINNRILAKIHQSPLIPE
jgi:hypothetical protein